MTRFPGIAQIPSLLEEAGRAGELAGQRLGGDAPGVVHPVLGGLLLLGLAAPDGLLDIPVLLVLGNEAL